MLNILFGVMKKFKNDESKHKISLFLITINFLCSRRPGWNPATVHWLHAFPPASTGTLLSDEAILIAAGLRFSVPAFRIDVITVFPASWAPAEFYGMQPSMTSFFGPWPQLTCRLRSSPGACWELIEKRPDGMTLVYGSRSGLGRHLCQFNGSVPCPERRKI